MHIYIYVCVCVCVCVCIKIKVYTYYLQCIDYVSKYITYPYQVKDILNNAGGHKLV